MKKSEAIRQIKSTIKSLEESIKFLEESEQKTVKVYSNTDNGGYSDDPSEVEEITFTLDIDEDDDDLIIGLCLVV